MVSSNSVTAIKGNAVGGSLYIAEGGYEGAVSLTTDWDTIAKELGLASSAEGVALAQSADSNVIVAWGDKEIDELWSNSSVSVTINLFSFKDVNTLKALFGSANVTKTGSTIKVSGRGASSSEKNSIIVVGVDKRGLAAVLFCRIAAIDPNFEFTWNDTDPVAVPAVFKLYKDDAGEFFQMLLEDDATIPGGGE